MAWRGSGVRIPSAPPKTTACELQAVVCHFRGPTCGVMPQGACRSAWRRAAVSVRHLPDAILPPVDLRYSQGVDAWHAVDRRRGVLEPNGVRDITERFGLQQLELERGAVREALREMSEQFIELCLPAGVLPGAENSDRVVP